MFFFYPDMLKQSITAITPRDLQELGVRGLLLDVDNTLTTHGSQVLDPAIQAWLTEMEARGFSLTVVSNSWPRRVSVFAKKIGLRHIAFACKPCPVGFWRAARRLGLHRRECVAIGDQTFTDVLGARLAGVHIIQLFPIKKEAGKPTLRFKRWIEGYILGGYTKKLSKNAEVHKKQ